jgi:hypothetical protein
LQLCGFFATQHIYSPPPPVHTRQVPAGSKPELILVCGLDGLTSTRRWLSFCIQLSFSLQFPAHAFSFPEPVFVNLLRSPGIDSQPDRPVRQPYLSHRAAMLHRQVSESIPGLLKRLQIRVLCPLSKEYASLKGGREVGDG